MIYILLAFLLILSFILSYINVNNKTLKNFLFIILFLIMFLISGFRTYEVGNDSFTYYYYYKLIGLGYIEPDIQKFFTGRWEYGYILLNKLLYSISDSYTLLFVTFSFIFLFCMFFVIKKMSTDIFLSLIIFFGYRIFTFSMSSLRSSIAIGILLLSIYFYLNNKKILSLLLVIIATCFHLSSIIFLIIYLLNYFKINIKNIILLGIILVILFFNINSILNIFINIFEKYKVYNDDNVQIVNTGTLLNFLLILIILFLCEFYLTRFSKENYKIEFFRKISYLAFSFSFIGIQVPMFGRFTLLFSSIFIIYIPIVIDQISDYKLRFYLKYFFIFLFLSYFFVILYLRPEWNIITPYKNVLFDF